MEQQPELSLLQRLFYFFFPFLIAGAGLTVLYFIVDSQFIGKLYLLMTIYFFPPFGKETVIPIGISGGWVTVPFSTTEVYVPPIDPWVMALSIAFVDIMVALFLVWNYDLVKKIPLLGTLVVKIEKAGKGTASKYQWIKKLEFVGIVLFVIIPFQGSGGFIASIVGRLLGMKRWNVFIAIAIGSLISTILVAYFANIIFSVLVKNFLLGILLIIILFLILFIIYIYRKGLNKTRIKKQQ